MSAAARHVRVADVGRSCLVRACTCRDTTSRTAADAALATAEARLRAALAERRLLEEQLRQAQKMEAIGQLAGGVAHDFNNLLTAIIGYADLLGSAVGTGSPLREDIEQIRMAGTRAAALAQRLLTFSRRDPARTQTIDLAAIVDGIERMLRPLIGGGVRLTIQCGQPAWVYADPGEIEQVIMNLATNARDAMGAGGELTILTGCTAVDGDRVDGVPAGQYAVLRVSDTGCGMTTAVRARIFEPFFTTKPPEKGTGLGLSMIHSIIADAGGHVTVASRPGEGTTFTVYLPAVDAAVERMPAAV